MIVIGLEKANDRVLEMLCSDFEKEMKESQLSFLSQLVYTKDQL